MGVTPARSCKRCRGCWDCSYRTASKSRDKEAVVKRVEDMIEYDAEAKKAEVSYPWTEDIWKLKDNQKQAVVFQSSVRGRLLKDENSVEACNTELRKFMDRGAITKLASDEITI